MVRWTATIILCLVLPALESPLRGQIATTVKSPVGIDFSFAGYGGDGGELPQVAAVLTVRPSGHDDTALIQGALDRIAQLPPAPNGFRGALLLSPGRFHIDGQLHMRASGVVLRGSGREKSVLIAERQGRRSLIETGGVADPATGKTRAVTEDAPA